MSTVRVMNGREQKIALGHPWVYGNEIEARIGPIADGDVVSVVDARGKPLGVGVYNSASLLTVRLLSHRVETIDEEFIRGRVRQALGFRRMLKRPDTDSYRLIFGEADRLPGVIADQFGGVIVLQVLCLGMERWTDAIADELIRQMQPDTLVLKNDDAIRLKEGLTLYTAVLHGPPAERVTLLENGLRFTLDLAGGQKTGYYLDQKLNHLALRPYCRKGRVLDCFTYVGGFALNAAAGGAQSVLGVDSSQDALTLARRNAQDNGFAQVAFEAANCFDFLRQQVREKRLYDAVVLDPPAFTKSKAALESASRGYKEINLSAMRLLPPGGVLATHSCSYHMSEELFLQVVLSAAQDLRRAVRIIEVRRQDADHPQLSGYPESHYLKSLWLQMLD